MKLNIENKEKVFRKNIIVFFVLVCLLILSSVYFIHSLELSYNSGELKIHHKNQEILSNEVASIHTWMTFDYVNVVFKLPPDYLKDRLSIIDPRYPNIRIDRYAMKQGESKQQLLYTIQQLVNQNIKGKI